MGSGTLTSLETADAARTHNRLRGLAQMITLARRAARENIRQNIPPCAGAESYFSR